MRKYLHLVNIALIVAANMFCLPVRSEEPAPASQSSTGDEALILNLDKNWKLVNKKQAGNQYVLQFLPEGADCNNPAEMITVTTISGIAPGKDARTYIIQMRNAMENAKESAQFKWTIIKDSPEDASCEYTLSRHSKIPKQHEMLRAIRGGAEIHSIIYHFGKETLTPAEKERAWGIVNAVKLSPASSH